MKKSLIIFYFFFLGSSLFSCNDEFLERYPETDISQENFFNNEEDLNTYIYGLYDFPGIDIYINDVSTDNAATTGATELKNIMIGSSTSSNITSGWDWEKLRKINFFLANFKKAQLPQETLNNYEGLARFFRAQFYMDKVKRFSDVPWYNKVMETNDPDLFKGRDTRTLVVDSIFNDYLFATKNIKEDKRSGAVNKWVALAFLARNALYEGTYRKYHDELKLKESADKYLQIARDASLEIINNSGRSLYSTGNPSADYSSLFNSTALEGNPEVILGNFNQNNVKNSGWWAYMFGNYEVSPVRDLLQSYLMKDGSYYTSQPGFETFQFVKEFENRDPRVYQTFAYPGFQLINTSTYAQGGGLYVQQLQKNFSGYHQIKGFVNNTDVAIMNSVDVPLLRFAEVLLTYAEAQAELGNLSQGDLDITINKIRSRAGMKPLSINPQVDPVQQAKYPGLSNSTPQWAELLEIRRERRIELALEGFRYDDLMRWQAGKLLEKEPEGLYFPGLGKYDLTGDGIEDIKLIANSESIPTEKEKNSLGVQLIYYRAGAQGSDASVYLKNGNSGTIVTDPERGEFVNPKYYYRPVPQSDVVVNPNLTQIFGW